MENIYARFTILNMSAHQNGKPMREILEKEKLSVNTSLMGIVLVGVAVTLVLAMM